MKENYDLVCSFDELDIIKGDDTDEYKSKFIGRMKGWASTPDLDRDGERVLQEGLETDYLVKKGFINWNHKSEEIIGVPRLAEVRDRGDGLGKGLYTEFDLLKGVAMAQKTLDTTKALSGTGRALGLSLEGKKLAVSKTGTILKAMVMNIAVCPNPKNAGTSVEALVKAMVSNDEEALNKFAPFADSEDQIIDRLSGIVASAMSKALDAGYETNGTQQTGGDAIRKEEIEIVRNDLVELPPGHTLREWSFEDGDLKEIKKALVTQADNRGGKLTRVESALLTFIASDNSSLVDSFKVFGLL